jgi:hypothetical protein
MAAGAACVSASTAEMTPAAEVASASATSTALGEGWLGRESGDRQDKTGESDSGRGRSTALRLAGTKNEIARNSGHDDASCPTGRQASRIVRQAKRRIALHFNPLFRESRGT